MQNKDWLDRMYNNRALVPEHGEHLMHWSDASRDARAAHIHRADVRYGKGPMETLDIFLAAKPNAPVVVFLHGGYWRSLDKDDHSFIAPAFTHQGACVVVPNYALCPAVTIPDIVMQMVKALAWTWRCIATYGGDPSRITVIGHSAGGHLATMLLACDWAGYDKALPIDLVKNAMSISGLYDLEPVMNTPFLKDTLRLTTEQVSLASPAWLPQPKRRRLYSLVGGDESAEFLRHNTLMQSAWGKKTVPVSEALPGLNHFSVLEELSAPWSRLHKLALKLAGL